MCPKTSCLKKKRVTGKWLPAWITLNIIILLIVNCMPHPMPRFQVERMVSSLKWRLKTGALVSSPAITQDGTIYVGSRDHCLYAINPDGSMKWKFNTGASVGSSPAIAQDGTIYVGSCDGHLYAINPDGSMK